MKVSRGGAKAPEYVQRVDPTPIPLTTNRKLALVMGKFMAEDAAKYLENSRRSSELAPVHVGTWSILMLTKGVGTLFAPRPFFIWLREAFFG